MLFLMVLFLDIRADNEGSIEIKNSEALACYAVYGAPLGVIECCAPWWYFCFSDEGIIVDGYPTYGN